MPKRAKGPAGAPADTTQTQATKGKIRATRASVPSRARARTPEDKERARLALKLNDGNVKAAAAQSGVSRRTISRWITKGDFNPDEWEHLRKERERTAVELAYEGLSRHLEAIRDPGRVTVVTKAGAVVDLGVDLKASAQVIRAQAEVIKTLGGMPAKPHGAEDDGDGKTVKIEMVWPDYTPDGKVVPLHRKAVSA